jgi:hypothetical protein
LGRCSSDPLGINNMKSVFILQHSYESSDTGEEETKFIGVYSSKKKAQEAIERLSRQPGFKDLPDYFYIDEYEIDQDNWCEGFVIERYEPIWSVWRQDDNGNVFMVKNGLTEIDALRLVREFERKGHKQIYWAKENL